MSAVTYTLHQRVRYDYTSPVANLRQRLFVVPRARHGSQRRRSWSIDVAGAGPVSPRVGRDRFGNVRVDVHLPRVESWVEFAIVTSVVTGAASLSPRVRPDPRLLAPTRLTGTDEAVAAVGRSIRDPRDTDEICRAVHASLTYEWGITDVTTTAGAALRGGRGVCQDYAHVMIAVCRLLGRPARYVSGHLVGEGGSHAWVEVLTPAPDGGGLVVEAWDPTHARRATASYVTVAVGRDYLDVAPVSGTYDGAADAGTLSVRKNLAAA